MATGQTRVLALAACDDMETAARHVAEALSSADARRGQDLVHAAYLRIEQPVADVDVTGWLRALSPLPRFYWGARDRDFRIAGAGIAEEVEAGDFDALTPLVERFASGDAAESARVFATARFDVLTEATGWWSAFKRVYLQVPLLELRSAGAGFVLAVNLKVGDGLRSGWFDAQRRIAAKAVIRGTRAAETGGPAQVGEPVRASRQGWYERVGALLAALRSGEMEKAVLARAETREASARIDPLDLLGTLHADQPDAFHFLVQPTPQVAFLGASPERLYRREGRDVRTEALAGTRPRGGSEAEDARLARDLRESEKDQREHGLVRQHILDRLTPLCDALAAADGPRVHSLAHLHHLHTPIEATLKDGVTDAALLAALHPTPAVCGMPADAAMAFIRATEDFDRGLYAGPVGCFGRDAAECAVAIRSALVQGRKVQLFAGAGIVEGSDADAEWEETVNKMKAMQATLGRGDVE